MNSTELIDEEDSDSSVDLVYAPQTAVDGVITLSYVNRNYPFLYHNPYTGSISGIYADMWRTLATMEKKTIVFKTGTVYGGYTPDPVTGQYDGILGWLQEGEVDGISEEFTYRASRMEYFYATTPIDYSVETFYEKTTSQTDDINNFIVFPPLLWVLIIISFVSINIVERTVLVVRYRLHIGTRERREKTEGKKCRFVGRLMKKLQGHKHLMRIFNFLQDFFSPEITWDFYSSDNRRHHMLLYILGSLFINFFYNAVFAGNAVVTVTKADIHLKELLVLFQTDQKALLMRDLAYIKRNTLEEMFGRDVYDDRNRVQIEPDMQQFLNELCLTPFLVGFVSNFQTDAYNPNDPFTIPCKLAQIDPFGTFSPSSLVGQGMYGKERPVTFYVGKHMKQSSMNRFNQIILRLYDNQKMVDVWWRRYTSRPRQETTPTRLMSFDPVPLYTLKTFLIICACFYALAIVIFVVEIGIGILKHMRNR